MGVNFLNWGIPALLTVVIGAGTAVGTSGAAISGDLQARAAAVLDGDKSAWATVRFEMRDAYVSGTAASESDVQAVLQRVAQVHGVRSVTSDAVVAETLSPYPFRASIADRILTIEGAVPDAEARDEITALAGKDASIDLKVVAGAPDRTAWLAAVGYALDQLRKMDEGTASLSDLELNLSGRAENPKSYDALVLAEQAGPPDGVSVSRREVTPPLAAPYTLAFEFDGSAVKLSGETPDETLPETLGDLVPDGIEVSKSLALASGEPDAFAEHARMLLENLLKLEQGRAEISGDTITLSGLPRDVATADEVRTAVAAIGAKVTLGPPHVADYTLAAERDDERIVLSGYVPDEPSKLRLGQFLGVDARALQLGRGAPDHFQSGVDFLLQSVGHMSEGGGAIDGTTLSLRGRAASPADYAALQATVGLGAPQGFTFADVELRPPLASPFTWRADKTAEGGYSVSGFAPSSEVKKELIGALPEPVKESVDVADGAPAGFAATAAKALDVLRNLSSGSVVYDGTSWTVSGRADTPELADAAQAAFAASGLEAAGGTYDVATPAPIPQIDPYAFAATKSADGALRLSGYLPSENVRKGLLLRARGPVSDETVVANGAPDGFESAAAAGFDALMALDTGKLSLSGDDWSLEGDIPTTKRRQALEAVLARTTTADDWHIALQAADAAPVVTPFRWAAEKDAEGRVRLSGYVPTEALRKFLAVRAGTVAQDSSLVGSGEPNGFSEAALAGLDALSHLSEGRVAFADGGWSLSGMPASETDATQALAALDGQQWSTDLAAPPPESAEAAAPPVEQPVESAAAPSAEAAAAEEPIAVPPAEATTSDETATTESEVATTAEENMAAEDAVTAAGTSGDAPMAAPDVAVTGSTEAAPPVGAEAPGDSQLQVATAEPPAAAEPTPPSAPAFVFGAKKALGGQVDFAGSIPADPVRDELARIVGSKPSDQLLVAEGSPGDFAANAEAGARALVALADGSYGLDNGTWVLTGRAVSDAQRQAALSSLTGTSGQWRTDVTLVPPVDYCRAEIDTFAKRNAILFQSGSASITTDSRSALDELAGYLQLCPKTRVDVVGHTDADGDSDANLILSVDRAEAVVDALIERGVGEERLYAIGYGESLPVASNDTAAGKRANRRIAFSLHDDGQ